MMEIRSESLNRTDNFFTESKKFWSWFLLMELNVHNSILRESESFWKIWLDIREWNMIWFQCLQAETISFYSMWKIFILWKIFQELKKCSFLSINMWILYIYLDQSNMDPFPVW